MRFCLEKKEEEKKKKKKELSPESNLGPLILRDSSRYAYNSEGVAAATLKGPGENTVCAYGVETVKEVLTLSLRLYEPLLCLNNKPTVCCIVLASTGIVASYPGSRRGAWLGEGERKREPGIHCSRMHIKSPEFWGLTYSQ